MSDTHARAGEATAAPMAGDAPPPKAHAQPSYMLIWGVLFVLTIVEVGVAYLGLPQRVLVISLVLLALWKAALVAMYYMHLRFEPKRLVYMVLAPLPLALILVLAILMEF